MCREEYPPTTTTATPLPPLRHLVQGHLLIPQGGLLSRDLPLQLPRHYGRALQVCSLALQVCSLTLRPLL